MSVHKWRLIADLILNNKYKYAAEIGVSKGATVNGVRAILKQHVYQLEKYYGIDPFLEPYFAMDDETRQNLFQWQAYVELKYKSEDALPYIKELDLVFIDGCHIPEIMASDFIAYGDKIRVGGCIVGHDYGLSLETQYGNYADITKYINACFGSENINLIQDTRDESGKPNYLWWTYKVEEGVYAKIRPDSI